jgi:ATP-binding cassette, subfamily C (CFTR/MRP), member 4
VWRLKTAIRTDERVRLMNEIIQGIQVIKMYAWEKPFAALVELARRKEVRVIRYVSYIRGIILSFIMFTTRVSVFISLIAFALLGNVVTAKQAFMITAYYNILRPTMTIFFPQGIGQLAETIVSVRRIEKYMLYDEIKNQKKGAMSDNEGGDKPAGSKNHSELNELTVSGSEQSTITKNVPEKELLDSSNENEKAPVNGSTQHLSETGVMVQNLKAKWVPESPEYTLNDVNLHVQPGTLVAVIGPVGSGKTSLLQTILGELTPESGSIAVNGVISYASQEPWLFSATVRQNILFGLPMERDRYRQVVKKCALERDFQLFSHGDKTIVGERGVSLSGGQKARISLARAVYRRAAVYLLDDPLSAVDSHVGKHLFDKCMREYLRGKIVILVTHQLQYLQHADQIVILDHGRVKAVGTYDSLRETGLDFAKLLAEPSDDEAGSRSGSVRRNSSTRLNRQNSESSVHSAEETGVDETNVTQLNEEKRQVGKIGLELYTNYFKAGGGLFIFIILLSFFVVSQFLASAGDYFLSYWVKKAAERSPVLNETNFEVERNFTDSVAAVFSRQTRETTNGFDDFIESAKTFVETLIADENFDVYVFSFITIATVLVTLWRSFMFFNVAMRASKNLHNKMFVGITHASMYFFNTNPSGRILNRFSKDMGQIDEILPSIMIDVIQIFLSLLGIVVVVGIVNPYFLIPTVLVGILFYYMRTFYLLTSRSIKRMEATTRSPIYSHLAATLNGLSTIRAFGAERILVKEFDNHQDLHSGAFYLFIATSRAFGFYLDVCSVLYIAIITLSFFVFPTDGGNVGLAITQALGLTGMVQWGMRQSAELENTMTAVERVVEYESVDPEGELESAEDQRPPKTWPAEGRIKFDKVSLRYSPEAGTDNVLRELEFDIQPTEKVGIVGRTGAGKSSIINALFRLSYTEGPIIIDMRDTKTIGLHDLRSRISIIPQEPVLFSGTLRYNLDPFEEYADDKLWRALSDVKLREMVKELPQGLSSKISEGGSNFSVGQRQLVCLARAILRENKILVMDEATANVDPQTDALIQTTIREKFADCTVLTIAHRLHTVSDGN